MIKVNKYSLFIIGFLLISIAYLIFNNDGEKYNILVLGTSYVIVVLSILNIFLFDSLPFSLNKIFYLFSLFFLGIAPTIQFKQNVHFLGDNGVLSDNDFIFGNCIFIGVLLIYSLVYWFLKKRKTETIDTNFFKKLDLNYPNKYIAILSILFAFIFFACLKFNFEAIFIRSYLWRDSSEYSTPMLSMFNIIRASPLVFFLYFKLNGKKNIYVEILLLLLIVLCNFPIATPRYKTAIVYLPILIIYFRGYLKKNNFSIAFILSFLSVFPYFSHFRYNTNLLPSKIFDFGMFAEAHFDSYQNTLNVITKNMITYGEQLLSVVLFFVPRSIWKEKSYNTGQLLAENLGYEGFSNVAVSFFGEGYINFGFIGIIIFTIFIAFVNVNSDTYFWSNKRRNVCFIIIYLIMIPFEFFLLRGSLLTSTANLTGYIVLVVLIYWILNKNKQIRFFK